MTHAELRQHFYAQLSEGYLQGELQSLYHWCVQELHGWSRAEAYARSEDEVEEDKRDEWESVIARLRNHEPIQYIFNKVQFGDLKLYVDPTVLIPRPETEELVSWVLEDETNERLSVLDIGTGSGCIALILKHQRAAWEVSGCDVSLGALNVATLNSAEYLLDIDWFDCDIRTDSIPVVDVIVSNPPYIPVNLHHTLEPNVLDHEPHLALFSPENDAFYFFRRIAELALETGCKRIYFETHATEMDVLKEVLASIWNGEIEIKKDFSGKERFVRLSK